MLNTSTSAASPACRAIASLVLLALLFSLTACGASSTPAPAPQATTRTAATTAAQPTAAANKPASTATVLATKPIVGKPFEVKRPPDPKPLQLSNATSALALRAYIAARLKTERFLATNPDSISPEQRKALASELADAWLLADQTVSLAANTADEVEILLSAEAKPLSFRPGSASIILASLNQQQDQIDYQAWAEELTKKYDAIKGNQKLKVLAKQLGVDVKTAKMQVDLAQDIIFGESMLYGEHWDKVTKVYEVVKSSAKVGMVITSAIYTGGGSLSALGSSSLTIAEAGGLIVSSVDAIVDVTETTANVILGDGNNVAVSTDEAKKYIAPASSLLGLQGFASSTLGEQIGYIGDTLTDFYYDGKILGIKVFGNDDGSSKLSAQQISINGASPADVISTLNQNGFKLLPPTTSATPAGLQPQPDEAGVIDTILKTVGSVGVSPADTELLIDRYLEALKEMMDEFADDADEDDEDEPMTEEDKRNEARRRMDEHIPLSIDIENGCVVKSKRGTFQCVYDKQNKTLTFDGLVVDIRNFEVRLAE